MNILVTGSNGQLGNWMRIVSSGSVDRYIFTDVADLDITDAEAVRDTVRNQEVDVIVNCAAYTDVERAEKDYDSAQLINAVAVRHLADAMKETDGLLIHISTDYVFGGAEGNTPRTETQESDPTGVYGLTKLHGEREIAESGCRAVIIRTAWLYSEFGKNFVKTMLALTSSRDEIRVVFDQCGTPTYAGDLAAAIFDMLEHRKVAGKEGIYHFSDEGVCSWFDFARLIASIAGNTRCDILPCHSDEFPSSVVRPAYSVLDKTKYKETFGMRVPYWADSLKKCINNLMKDEA